MWNCWYFSEDLLLLVLVRLPARSLLRFKCVSKSWNTLISNPKFKKMHLDQSNIDPNPNILVMVRRDKQENILPSPSPSPSPSPCCSEKRKRKKVPASWEWDALVVEFPDQGNLSGFGNITQYWLPGLRQSWKPTLLGSCNGLLCIKIIDDIVLFNPVTRSFWKLPERASGKTYLGYVFGFGYDDAHDDYKVFISRYYDKCEIYSLRSNSWTAVILPYQYHFDLACGFLVNCVLHWIVKKDGKYIIKAFDLREEKHWIFPMPETLENSYVKMTVLNGCFCVIVYSKSVAASTEFWVLKDYGGRKDSWTRITTNLSDGIWSDGTRPMALLVGKEKMVTYKYSDGLNVVACDFVKDKVEKIIKIIPQGGGHIYTPREPIGWFVESLVQPWVRD